MAESKRQWWLGCFPTWEQIIPVYALGMMILFSWAIVMAFRDYSVNWALNLNVLEILSLFSYVIVGSFFESILLISALIIMSLALPRRLFGDRFVFRSSVFVIAFLGSIMYLYSRVYSFGILTLFDSWLRFFVITAVLLLAAGEIIQFVRKTFEALADRCIVFLYINLPLSAFSIIVVLIRNIS